MNNPQAQIIVTYVKETTGKKTLQTSNDTTESVKNNRSSRLLRATHRTKPGYPFQILTGRLGPIDITITITTFAFIIVKFVITIGFICR